MAGKIERTASLLCLLGTAALAAVQTQAVGQEAQTNLEMLRRGRTVVEGLQTGRPTRIVVFGDSLTAGWGADGTHVYHRMFADCLRHRFPDCDVQWIVSGNPGWTTADALRAAQRQVIGRQPDLVLLQFGGNDKGWGRDVLAFRRDFAKLLRRVSEESRALVIACLPPIAEDAADNAWSEVARQVAAEEGVPAADLDRAIRDGSPDFRGPFPHGSHPGSFTHVIMAKEVLRAFDLATGMKPTLRCRLVRGSMVSADDVYEVNAEISSLADRAIEWTARIEFGQDLREAGGRLEPGETLLVKERVPVPRDLPAGRSFAIPVHLWVRGGEYGSFDVAWLAMARAVSASGAEGGALPAEGRGWHEIGAGALVLGTHLWTGPADLAGRFRAVTLADRLRCEVRVVDDDVTVAGLNDPSQGDSVELYLDLRAQEQQGEPVYSADVLALQVIPPGQAGGWTRWRNLHELPEDLREIVVSAALNEDGYRVWVELPLAMIEARRGEAWGGIGFAIGINDADNGGTRKTQMMWSGIADNYLNPAYLAGLYADGLAEGATRRTLR